MRDMVDVYLEKQPTEVSIERLSQLARQYQRDLGGTIDNALSLAAMLVAQSGRSASRKGRTKRKAIDNPGYKQLKHSFAWAKKQKKQGKGISAAAQAAINQSITDPAFAPFLIERLTQGQKIMLPSWDKKDDPRRTIEEHSKGKVGGRGLAKFTWNLMAIATSRSRGTGRFFSRGRNYRVAKYKEQYGDGEGTHVARLVNSLTYLEDAYPGITDRAVQKGTKALNRELEKGMRRTAQKANKAA